MRDSVQLCGLRDAIEKQGMFDVIDSTIGNRASDDMADTAGVQRPKGVSYDSWRALAETKVYDLNKALQDAKSLGRSGVEIKRLEDELLRAQKEYDAINFMIRNIDNNPNNKPKIDALIKSTTAKLKEIEATYAPKREQVYAAIKADAEGPYSEFRRNLIIDYVQKYFKKYGLKAPPKVMYPLTGEEIDNFNSSDIYDQILAMADNPYLALMTSPPVEDEFGNVPLFGNGPGGSAAFPQVNAIFLAPNQNSGGATGHEFGHLWDTARHEAAGVPGAEHYADYNGLPQSTIAQERAASKGGGQIAYDATQQDYFHIPEGLPGNIVQAMKKLNAGIRMSREEADRQASRGLINYYGLGAAEDVNNQRRKAMSKIRGDTDGWGDSIRRRMRFASNMYKTQQQWYNDVKDQAQWIRENRWKSQHLPAFRGMQDGDFGPGPKPNVIGDGMEYHLSY